VISLVALLIIFATVIGSTAMMGILFYFLNRIRQLEGRVTGDLPTGALSEQLNRIQEDLFLAQEEMSRLTERMDFTEKLLMSGDEEAPPAKDSP
jgi:uncharacterized coiled-coil protein SlyX